MRIGHGFDVHAFGESVTGTVDLTLGGVPVPYDRPLIAHSDGDVVLHALSDAILGALAAGDIGQHFADTDSANEGMDSRDILRHCAGLMTDAGLRLGNADVTIIAQAPKMAPHTSAMIETIAQDLAVDASQVSVKATTTERLGYVGREEGIAAHAVVLLVS
ncbi:MAG: 2-C-methyl-D-erythritol 2,4-cyclodiphosphate synthase [Pseudomonadota bacterium]